MLAGRTGLVVEMPRLMVVARNKPPQLPSHDDRNRHGGERAHVAHVLEMNRRNAAKARQRQVDRAEPWGRVLALQRHRDVVGVRDQAYGVEAVEITGLARNVRRRKAMTGIGVVARIARLREHLAVTVTVEPVRQHASETGEPLHLHHRERQELVDRRRSLQVRQQPLRHQVDRGIHATRGEHAFELENVQRPDTVQRHVQRQRFDFDCGNHHRCVARDRSLPGLDDEAKDRLDTRGAFGSAVRAQQGIPIGTGSNQPTRAGIDHGHPPMGLDRARGPDGLVRTVGRGRQRRSRHR